jgi:hypothetical protein
MTKSERPETIMTERETEADKLLREAWARFHDTLQVIIDEVGWLAAARDRVDLAKRIPVFRAEMMSQCRLLADALGCDNHG